MPSQQVINLCSSTETVTKSLALHPTEQIHKIVSKLYNNPAGGSGLIESLTSKFKNTSFGGSGNNKSEEEEKRVLDDVARCGKFPYRPSDLFLKVRWFVVLYHIIYTDSSTTDIQRRTRYTQ